MTIKDQNRMVVRECQNSHNINWIPRRNIGILRMTGEVTDRFNEITLSGMALFWQKAIEFKIYNSFPHI